MANVTIKVDSKVIEKKINKAINDKTMLQIHNEFARIINPWVPMDEGILSQDIEVTPKYVRYKGPYAHYQYIGEIYSPNIPITENGVIVGWFSPKGQKKNPTGRQMEHSKEKHPLATSNWDRVALQSQMKVLERTVTNILSNELRRQN